MAVPSRLTCLLAVIACIIVGAFAGLNVARNNDRERRLRDHQTIRAQQNPAIQKVLEEIKAEIKALIVENDAVMFVEKRVCLYCVQIRSLFEKFQLPLTEIVIDENTLYVVPRLSKKQLYLQAFHEMAALTRTPALWAGGLPVRWTQVFLQKDESKGQHSDYLQPLLEGIQRVKAIRMKREMDAKEVGRGDL